MKSNMLVQMLVTSLLLGGTAVYADMPKGEYLDGKDSKVAVILAHGREGDPDAHVVGPLRKAIYRQLGFHTLSLQMVKPAQGQPLDESLAQDAYARIQAGLNFLKKEKKVERVYLMGYSMGGRSTTAFLANHPESGIAGFIGVGLWAGGMEPHNTNLNLRKVNIPVLDVYAENDKDAKFAAFRKKFASDRFKQVPIAGATHSYVGYDNHVADAVISWLKQQEAK